MRAHRLCRRDHIFIAGIQTPEQNIFLHRAIEQKRVLQNHAHLFAQRLLSHCPQVNTVHAHTAVSWVMEARQQFDDGRLARARLPHKRDRLARIHIQINLIED